MTRNRSLWLLLVSVAATLVLYVIPYGRIIAYPLILLSTYAHEMGHGLTALLVGGSFESLQMAADASGVALLRIPDSRLARAATSAGGLLGPAALAAVLFSFAPRQKGSRAALVGLGVIGVATLLLVVDGPVGWLFVGVLASSCLWFGVRASGNLAQSFTVFLALQLSLSVFSRADYLFTRSVGNRPSDVSQMAEALLLPYWFWGTVCGGVSVAILTFGLRRFLTRNELLS